MKLFIISLSILFGLTSCTQLRESVSNEEWQQERKEIKELRKIKPATSMTKIID